MVYKLKIINWNVNGVYSKKKILLTDFLRTTDIINEIKLTHRQKFTIQNYTTHRQDGHNTHASGGVAIVIKNNIPHIKMKLPKNSMEIVGIKLQDGKNIITAYNNPRNNFTNTDLDHILSYPKTLVIGDLNSRHIHWNCHI